MTGQTEKYSISLMHLVMREVITLCKSMETQTVLFISEMLSHCVLILCSISVARKAFLESSLCLHNLIYNPPIPTDCTSLASGQVGRGAEATATHSYFSAPTSPLWWQQSPWQYQNTLPRWAKSGTSSVWSSLSIKRHEDGCSKRNTVQINSAIIKDSELN